MWSIVLVVLGVTALGCAAVAIVVITAAIIFGKNGRQAKEQEKSKRSGGETPVTVPKKDGPGVWSKMMTKVGVLGGTTAIAGLLLLFLCLVFFTDLLDASPAHVYGWATANKNIIGVVVIFIVCGSVLYGVTSKKTQFLAALLGGTLLIMIGIGAWNNHTPIERCDNIYSNKTNSCILTESWTPWLLYKKEDVAQNYQVCTNETNSSNIEFLAGEGAFKMRTKKGEMGTHYRLVPVGTCHPDKF